MPSGYRWYNHNYDFIEKIKYMLSAKTSSDDRYI